MYILGANKYISRANVSISGHNMSILGVNMYILGFDGFMSFIFFLLSSTLNVKTELFAP